MGMSCTDLKPLLPTPITRVEITTALIHPHHDRALFMRPLAPQRLDLTSRSDLCAEFCRRATVAHDFLVVDGHGGVVVGPLALNSLGRGGGGEASVASWEVRWGGDP
jgi:hypothetical protein